MLGTLVIGETVQVNICRLKSSASICSPLYYLSYTISSVVTFLVIRAVYDSLQPPVRQG